MQHNPDPLAEVPDDHGRAPIRFTKETGRGVKRNFDQAKYKAVTAAKAVVCAIVMSCISFDSEAFLTDVCLVIGTV